MSGFGPKLICRAELAVILDITPRQVARNESRLGIRPYKVIINQKCVRYYLLETLNALKQRGMIR